MLDLDLHIKAVQDKLQLLLKSHQLLARENQRLQKELEKSQQQMVQRDEQILGLQQQVDALKLGTSAQSPEEKALLEKRINGYLKEIDKCLALLNT
ncbi:hypothetical protein [Sediminibacterium goheungense]|uniref:Cell division protein ZapB n=1 Tax=Sediminibacterium goheungense TaxID=1086393 RepID=A0A4R6IWJ7_9BACT|nr:hypothetical protein [Sediminibacterium goheungense]TDO26721.1 hypothetical protein BC659_2030 [Sediminibacterium goheungense]